MSPAIPWVESQGSGTPPLPIEERRFSLRLLDEIRLAKRRRRPLAAVARALPVTSSPGWWNAAAEVFLRSPDVGPARTALHCLAWGIAKRNEDALAAVIHFMAAESPRSFRGEVERLFKERT